MSDELGAALFEAAVLIALLVAVALPLSSYVVAAMEGAPSMARKVLGPLERGCARIVGARPDDSMGWKRYLVGALLMLRCGDCQPQLPGRPVKARKKGVKGAKSVAA